ncbi:MAG: SDR family oxidoreductase [Chloroflexi bacterium]|nr:SDR family oxidoreductase [Chloroflexota bacterium]
MLRDRTALVTGGTQGIGRAIVERFLAEGARVVTVARDAPGNLPAEVAFLPFDLANSREIPDLIGAAENAAGPLDILVNNAGIWRETPALSLDLLDWSQVIAVNLTAPVLLATAVARGMAERNYGRIVNITSIHGRFAAESALAYAAAKGGLEQATRNLAVDLASHGILVNAIAPGFIATRLSVMDGVHERDTSWFQQVYVENARLPLRRHAEPAEVAPSVAWLASEQNTYITGQVLGVDGGLSITF